ncbi:ATP-dependent helicase [Pareuzebyella sediminis]|uniref:ATP-dependent helicase n=1 Tax=Pareuzebyella sediminis TaxID=2607998 RepID=UPI0011ED8E66|nr:ATP-dependent helicase [Pareuzebyella sediminis]
MIEWPDQKNLYNPIRKHIKLSFEIVGDSDEMGEVIADDLINQGFDESQSKVLIFVQTRRGTEDATSNLEEALAERNLDYADKVDYYHAGLDSIDREEKYENYKSGKIVILIATKAFGMGMDIKNIHFIYHFGPSSTFEDYLQEVGRAGRNPKMLEEAGYSEENPLQSKCLITKQDFKNQKDRLHRNEITWNQVNQVRETIFKYISKFRKVEPDFENAFPLPLDLLEMFSEYEEIFNKDTFFRVVLYWLEKLGRIKLGVFTPTHLPIKLLDNDPDFSNIKSVEDRNDIERFHAVLETYESKYYPDAEIMMVDMGYIKDKAKIKGNSKLFEILFKSQKAKLIRLEREMKLTPTISRTEELNKWETTSTSATIEAVFNLAEELIDCSELGNQVNLGGEEIDELVKQVSSDYFISDNIFWKEPKNNKKNEFFTSDEVAQKLKEDFKRKRSKFAFKLINFLPKIRHKVIIEVEEGYDKPIITQLIYNAYRSNKEPLTELKSFKDDLERLIGYVSEEYIKRNIKEFNIVDLILELGLENRGEEYFQKLIFISKGLGYLKGGGDLVPMGIELFIKNTTDFEDDKQGSQDYDVKQEFIESSKMKELRLIALECLSGLEHRDHDRFIKRYFKCAGLSDLINLLEERIGENHPNLIAFREEALEKEKDKLNEKQLMVYNTTIDKNLQVIAGPGSGKTHTLILRIARLIQEEKIKPENILILAYNRAVVVELKDRLTRIFKALGYAKLIKRLKVFTFHGFIKFCLAEQIEGLDFKHWASTFLDITNESPGLIYQKLGLVKYIFIDEFQDITSERIELLKRIANPDQTKVCVIGDPNQSIYGYERAGLGDVMDPKPYYDEFKELYGPVELQLNLNYRSYPEILVQAEELLSLNNSKFPMPKLEAKLIPKSNKKYCEIINYLESPVDWKTKVMEAVNYEDENGVRYKQIAVMFRSNDQVFRAYNILHNLQIPNVRLRIQGAKGSLFKTREFYYFISKFAEKSTKILPSNYISKIEELKKHILQKYPNWDAYLLNIFHCIVLEFDREKEDDTTYSDLIDFIREIASSDDGQYGKIYQQNISSIIENFQDQELVITTMHKVKGLEFDVVIIPPSFSNLPMIDKVNIAIADAIEEERRLYYVAYSRAKFRLIAIKFKRELAMDRGEGFTFPQEQIRNHYGVSVDEGIDKFTMYWSASNYGGNSFEYIRDNVKLGDQITLKPTVNGVHTFWYAIINNTKVALLSLAMVRKLGQMQQVNGFIVSSIYVSTYEETQYSDSVNKKDYAKKWSSEAKDRGYVYLIDFSGYGNELNE